MKFKKVLKGTYITSKYLFKTTYFAGKTIFKIITSKPSRYIARKIGRATYKTGEYAVKTSGGLALSSVTWLSNILATELQSSLDRLTKNLIPEKSTIYSKAMDYGSDLKKFAKGGWDEYHRHHYGHDPVSSYVAVKNASKTDSTYDEISNWIKESLKDLQTPRGLPLFTISQETINTVSNFTAKFGITKEWLYDAMSHNFVEDIVAILAILFMWNKKEIDAINKCCGSLAASSAYSGNPFLMIIAIVKLGINYNKAKNKDKKISLFFDFIKGGSASAIFIGTSLAVGGPIWLGLVAGFVIMIYATKYLEKYIDPKLISKNFYLGIKTIFNSDHRATRTIMK